MGQKVKIASKTPESKKEKSVSRIRKTASSQSINSPVDHIMFLERNMGNQAVQRLCKYGIMQAKLKIGQPGDKYEQEADRVADAVMWMPEPQVPRQLEQEEMEELIQTTGLTEQITPFVQRRVEEEEEREILQTKLVPGQNSEVTSDLESRINFVRGGGQPLPESVRAFFEPRFNYDFSQVRIHTNAQAAEMARRVNSRAFTAGQDIVFGMGQYTPGTRVYQQLLAHELVHVVQQIGNKRNSSLGGHFDATFEQDSQAATPLAPRIKPIPVCRFSRSSLMQMKNASGSISLTFIEWTTTEDGRLYRNIRWAPELSEAGYEILTYVKTEKGWEQKVPAMDTPVSQVRWLIKPPKGKGLWADAGHIVPKLMRILKRLRAAKPKEKVEKMEPVEFFSDPKFENIGSPGEWKLRANTKEGVKFYEDMFRGEIFAVEVPCFTREPGEMAGYIRRETVTLKSGQRLGDLSVIGRLNGMVLVKHSFYGEPAIFQYWSDFFYKSVRDKADADETVRKQLREICTK